VYSTLLYTLKGTVQRKLTWVKSGINRKLLTWAWAAWALFYILRNCEKKFSQCSRLSIVRRSKYFLHETVVLEKQNDVAPAPLPAVLPYYFNIYILHILFGMAKEIYNKFFH
jgi:hypothetical protein